MAVNSAKGKCTMLHCTDPPTHGHARSCPVRHAARRLRHRLERGRRHRPAAARGRCGAHAGRAAAPPPRHAQGRAAPGRAAGDCRDRGAAGRRSRRPGGCRAGHGRRAGLPSPRLRCGALQSGRAAPAPTANSPRNWASRALRAPSARPWAPIRSRSSCPATACSPPQDAAAVSRRRAAWPPSCACWRSKGRASATSRRCSMPPPRMLRHLPWPVARPAS